MTCKNDLCYANTEVSKGNCALWNNQEIANCKTKQEYDRRALVYGWVEIEPEETVTETKVQDIEYSVTPWKCNYCGVTNTVGTDICLNCHTNVNEGVNNG